MKVFTCERNTLYGISILAYIISARECDIGAKNCPPIQVAAQLAALEAMMNIHHSHHVPLRYGKTEAQKILARAFNPPLREILNLTTIAGTGLCIQVHVPR